MILFDSLLISNHWLCVDDVSNSITISRNSYLQQKIEKKFITFFIGEVLFDKNDFLVSITREKQIRPVGVSA